MKEQQMLESLGESPYLSAEEVARARRRAERARWKPAADRVRSSAEAAMERAGEPPAFDSGWYDANPNRPYSETYVEWHDYIRPAKRLARRVRTLLRAGRLFRRVDWLRAARELALHLAGELGYHVRHHDAGMGYAHVGQGLAEAYAVLGDRLKPEEREGLRAALEPCGEAVRRSTRHWLEELARMPYSNHFAAHRRGLLCLGLVLDRSDWVEEAMDGPRGFAELLVGATLDNGLCHESSTLYHFATLGGLLQMAELVRHSPRLGRDLYRETFANGRCLKQMLDAPLGLLLPTGALPPLGDCYAVRRPLWERCAGLYEQAYAVYGDPRYAWLLDRGGERNTPAALFYGAEEPAEAQAPHIRSRLWVEHGYGLLTGCSPGEYWESQAPAAVLTGDRSGIHNHKDSLGLQVVAGRRLWTEDIESRAVEAHGYSAPIQRAFNRTMLAHNLVVVDESDQRPLERPLEVVEFKPLPDCRTCAMADRRGELYPGVRMMRTVAVTGGYCLDCFQVVGGERHRYDWLVHPRADAPADCDLRFSPVELPERTPYSVLSSAAVAPLERPRADLGWRQDDQRFRLSVRATAVEGELTSPRFIRAEWPVTSDRSDEATREMWMLRVDGVCVDFVALYQLETDRPPWRVTRAERVRRGGEQELHVTVADAETTRRHVLSTLAPSGDAEAP